ncbi:hypothetical protein [Sphingobacterium bambusae]|uniref:Uncharacterized protein n=1 Tax=Sphingobacterium bambusae TaxID=662858 RepID=A0ABW6BJE4_9SPHI|nr:hypothetical protein [Sphingobacterium bambusae]WPL49415.1 hypothetical protein SCB77_02975 [Sphingobacterium bambusae]
MFKKVMTLAVAIVAIGSAFVGSSNAKNLLQQNRWVLISNENETVSATTARNACPGIEDTCAYEVNAQGQPTGQTFGHI